MRSSIRFSIRSIPIDSDQFRASSKPANVAKARVQNSNRRASGKSS